MIRVAAVGDVDLGAIDSGACRPAYEDVADRADVLLLAGDLTRLGTAAEARVVGEEFADLGVPVVAVLGNHDHHSGEPGLVCSVLRDHGLTVLEGEGVVLRVRDETLGVAGAKGFGGGFVGRSASNFGEQEMKNFATAGVVAAQALEAAFDGDSHLTIGAIPRRGPSVDVDRFVPLLEQVLRRVQPETVLADAGYDSEPNHRHARERRGVRSVIPAEIGRPSPKPPTGRWRRLMSSAQASK